MGRPKGSTNKKTVEESPIIEEPKSIHATVTTTNGAFSNPVEHTKEKPKVQVDLTRCLRCEKELDKFVASSDGKFCNEKCLKEYYK